MQDIEKLELFHNALNICDKAYRVNQRYLKELLVSVGMIGDMPHLSAGVRRAMGLIDTIDGWKKRCYDNAMNEKNSLGTIYRCQEFIRNINKDIRALRKARKGVR